MTREELLAKIVRPLVWEEPCQKNNQTHLARSIFGEYYVHVDGGRHQAWLEANEKPYENLIGEECGDLLTAQAAADADYRALTGAALDLGLLMELVEAASRVQRAYWDETDDMVDGVYAIDTILAKLKEPTNG